MRVEVELHGTTRMAKPDRPNFSTPARIFFGVIAIVVIVALLAFLGFIH